MSLHTINSPVQLYIGSVPESGREDAEALKEIEQSLLETMRGRATREHIFETLAINTEAWIECHGKLVAARKEIEALKLELKKFQ